MVASVVLAAAGEEESSTNKASNSSPFHLSVMVEVEGEGPIANLEKDFCRLINYTHVIHF